MNARNLPTLPSNMGILPTSKRPQPSNKGQPSNTACWKAGRARNPIESRVSYPSFLPSNTSNTHTEKQARGGWGDMRVGMLEGWRDRDWERRGDDRKTNHRGNENER